MEFRTLELLGAALLCAGVGIFCLRSLTATGNEKQHATMSRCAGAAYGALFLAAVAANGFVGFVLALVGLAVVRLVLLAPILLSQRAGWKGIVIGSLPLLLVLAGGFFYNLGMLALVLSGTRSGDLLPHVAGMLVCVAGVEILLCFRSMVLSRLALRRSASS